MGIIKSTEFLPVVSAIVMENALKAGLSEMTSDLLAKRVVAGFVSTFSSGPALYIPMGRYRKTAETHAGIVADFTGNNHTELARKYGVSVVTVYKVLQRHREGKTLKPRKQSDQTMELFSAIVKENALKVGVSEMTSDLLAKGVTAGIAEAFAGALVMVPRRKDQ